MWSFISTFTTAKRSLSMINRDFSLLANSQDRSLGQCFQFIIPHNLISGMCEFHHNYKRDVQDIFKTIINVSK